MKELDIEKKARRYDEAIERAKKVLLDCTSEERKVVEYISPELAKSDGERIRKALLEMVHDTTGDSLWVDYNVHKDDCLAWLEKQGQTFTKKDVDDAYLKGVCDTKQELEKQGWQKPWSEEDENMITDLSVIVHTYFSEISGIPFKYDLSEDKIRTWLKSIKDKVHIQPKQEWSKEDEKCIRLSTDIIDSSLRAGFCVQLDRDRCVDWLKSLRPQNTWKPSDEQMRALNYVVNIMASSESPKENDYYFNVFKDLREQLKKLRKE